MDYQTQYQEARAKELQAAQAATEIRENARLDRAAHKLNLQAFVVERQQAAPASRMTHLGTNRKPVTLTARALYFELQRGTLDRASNSQLASRCATSESDVIGALAELELAGFVQVLTVDGVRELRALPPSLMNFDNQVR